MRSNQQGRQEGDWKVSVVIPAYNVDRYIGRAIESVLGQSLAADEIIVVDDGSSDQTGEVVKGYGSKVRYLRQENLGASAARNTGIRAAGHRWIAFLDGDDEWFSEKLALQVELLKANPELSWVSGNFIRCDCRENRESSDLEPLGGEALLGGKEYFDDFFFAYLSHAYGWTGTMVIERSVLAEAGYFTEGLRRLNDLDMWFRIAYLRPAIGFISRPLAMYHMDIPNSIVKTQKEPSILRGFIDSHLELAAKHGRLEDFRPCAALIVGLWMRGLLEVQRGRKVRDLIRRYHGLFSRYHNMTTAIASVFPKAACFYERTKGRMRSRSGGKDIQKVRAI